MVQNDIDIPILNNEQLSKNLKKGILLTSYIKKGTEDEFISMLLSSVIDGYIDESINKYSSKHEYIKDLLFENEDRYGRRKLIINKIDFEKDKFIDYLKDILLGNDNDSCVLYMNYDIDFFAEMTYSIMSVPILLGNVQYLSNILRKIEKKPNLVAFLFGFHCEKNQIWLQSSIETKTIIYNMLK